MRLQLGYAWILGVWVMCVGVGCASSPRPTHLFEQPQTLLDRYAAVRPTLSGISAQARVDQRGERGRIRGTVMMFVRPQGQVRFDVMTQFGPALILTSDGERFALADLREKRFLTGPTCPANISRLLRLPLTSKQAARVLLGDVPDLEVTEQALEFSGERYVLTQMADTGHRQRLEFDVDPRDVKAAPAEQRVRLRKVVLLDTQGKEVWQVEYNEPRSMHLTDGQELILPYEVHVLQSASNTDTLVKFSEITLNPEIPQGAFVQQPPPGMLEEEAPCEL